MNNNINKPHEQANELIIDDQIWWWYAGGTVVIWEPDHTRHLLNAASVSETSFNITKGSKRKKSEILEQNIKQYIVKKLIKESK